MTATAPAEMKGMGSDALPAKTTTGKNQERISSTDLMSALGRKRRVDRSAGGEDGIWESLRHLPSA
jgi:hypothetical protein